MSQNEIGTAFAEAYASLNAAQKQAVDTIEGPVMVIAGPGTGKTQILTLRIAKILLETDMQPENILALTFTDAGAKAMRERLHRYIGARAYRVGIYTFHGFAERLIRGYPDAYTKVIGGRPASALDKIAIVESLLDDTQFKLLRPMGNPLYYVSAIIRMITTLKKEYVTPDRLAAIIATQTAQLNDTERVHTKGAHKGKVRSEYTNLERSIAKNSELLNVYRRYEAVMADQHLYDFEDMIVETVNALTHHEDMLRDLQETYQYVLADEHQDVNGSQNKILELLCNFHDQPNVFVVGDEKQAIYRFQGASLENFLYFTDLFKGTTQIDLVENYRSGQPVLDAAHSLVAVEDGPLKNLRVPLLAQSDKAAVEQRGFSHQAIEDGWIVDTVLAELEQGTAAEEIAVIVRTNREVEQLSALLRKRGIAVSASADGDILEHPITHTIQNLIEAVVDSHNEEALFSLLNSSFWGLSVSDFIKIAGARSYGQSLVTILESEEMLRQAGVENVTAAQNIVATITTARDMSSHESPQRVLEYLINQSGYLAHIIKADPIEGGRVVRRLYDEIEKMVLTDGKATLAEVREVLASYRAHHLPLFAPYIGASSNAVQVMTAHKSKGLEFETVLVAHVTDGLWGGSKKREDFKIPLTTLVSADDIDYLDDERRLLYVAMTRAKRKLFLSHSEQNQEGKELLPSRLFDDIDTAYLSVVTTEEIEQAFDPLGQLVGVALPMPTDVTLLQNILAQRGLSATALNNYLRSPYDYLYRNVLRIPEVQSTALQFGTVVHDVLEWVSGEMTKTSALPTATQVMTKLETALQRLPINQNEFIRLHEKGLGALIAYLDQTKNSFTKNAKTEFSLTVKLPTGLPEFPELTLTGKLDRLDLDETGRVIRVVDYKTGKPKTRNEIEGKTKSATGDYKRQLAFYALMLSLYGDERYLCRTGVLSFVEPDKKGVVHEEVFTITDEDIAELQDTLIQVTKEIVSGSFFAVPCDPNESAYCRLVNELLLRE